MEADEVFVTPTARFQLLPKKEGKALAKCGDERTLRSVISFLDTAKDISEGLDQGLLLRLGGHDGIDHGEQLLFAFAVTHADKKPLILTGDRKSLCAVLGSSDQLPEVHECLLERTITFESGLLLALRHMGFEALSKLLFASPKLDSALKLVVKDGMREADLVACLVSYSRAVAVYLALPDQLPADLFQPLQ